MRSVPGGDEFTVFGMSHVLVLLVFAAGAAALVWLGRRYGRAGAAGWSVRVLGLVVLGLQVVVQAHLMNTAPNIENRLPLHLSDLVGIVAAYALWSPCGWARALTYYWGIALSPQALLTPFYRCADFPSTDFLIFWGMHLFVVWAAIYLTWGLRIRPDWHAYRITVTVTACWAAATMMFNAVAGTNYGFLNRKPDTGSVLDLLGPWPWYLIPEFALVLGGWALMTWPWTRRRGIEARA
ncbi:TIGR02206 family membrane protein [Amycolatopsis cihanbeyliensis]|uniref:Putative integral membrane protein (TIGR02206 family) n=1 Tax=Amycolatopsis cihanbeyliensis TaxID=1128664 RepID=A0A542DQV1_AMYCI|nr:TIGR02206 family membrane protein [Amycolatopsis cihanbeyliensis]TQJ05481.1 putative integral membrane protein (TIGR02206 family) [Amycolatopsis cihanbeyliensis]